MSVRRKGLWAPRGVASGLGGRSGAGGWGELSFASGAVGASASSSVLEAPCTFLWGWGPCGLAWQPWLPEALGRRCSRRASLLSPLAQRWPRFSRRICSPSCSQPPPSHPCGRGPQGAGEGVGCVAAGPRELGKVWAEPRAGLCPGVRASLRIGPSRPGELALRLFLSRAAGHLSACWSVCLSLQQGRDLLEGRGHVGRSEPDQ